MSNDARGSSASAAVVDAPVATPAVQPASSLPAPAAPSDFAARVASATTPAQIAALKAEYFARPPAPQPAPAPEDGTTPEPTPAATPPPPAEPATPEPAAEPAGDPPAEPAEPPAEPATPAEPEPEPTPEPDSGPIKPIDRARLRFDNDVDKLAAAYKSRNSDLTLKECIARAEKDLGITPASESPAQPAQPAAPQVIGSKDLPQTIEAVDVSLTQLEGQLVEMTTALNFEEVAKINLQIRRLDRQRATIEKEADRQEIQQLNAYDSGFTQSEERAAQFYPQSVDKDSAFGKKMLEIEGNLQATNDPRFHSADKPFLVAQMAAVELNIAPKRQGSTPAPAVRPAAPAPTPQSKPKGMLTPGAARTAPAPAVNAVIDKQISEVKTPAQLEALKLKLGFKPRF